MVSGNVNSLNKSYYSSYMAKLNLFNVLYPWHFKLNLFKQEQKFLSNSYTNRTLPTITNKMSTVINVYLWLLVSIVCNNYKVQRYHNIMQLLFETDMLISLSHIQSNYAKRCWWSMFKYLDCTQRKSVGSIISSGKN